MQLIPPQRAAYYTRVAREISQSATGYALGNLLTSLIAGVVVFVTLIFLGVPFPLLWALWVALVDFLPMVGGALAGIPTVRGAERHRAQLPAVPGGSHSRAARRRREEAAEPPRSRAAVPAITVTTPR